MDKKKGGEETQTIVGKEEHETCGKDPGVSRRRLEGASLLHQRPGISGCGSRVFGTGRDAVKVSG
jgi:hypothetical protein